MPAFSFLQQTYGLTTHWNRLRETISMRVTPAPNCMKDFLDLPDDTRQSGLTLQLFPMVILVNQV